MKKLTYWYCPLCNYRVTALQMKSFRADFGCPNCKISFARFNPKFEKVVIAPNIGKTNDRV